MVMKKKAGAEWAREHSECTAFHLLEEAEYVVYRNNKIGESDGGWDLLIYDEDHEDGASVDVKAFYPSIEHGVGFFDKAYVELWASGYPSSLYNDDTDYWLMLRDYTDDGRFYKAYLIHTGCLINLIDESDLKIICRQTTKYKQIDNGGRGILIPWKKIENNSLLVWEGEYYGEENS